LVDKETIWYKLLNYSIWFFRHAILNISVLEYKLAQGCPCEFECSCKS